MAPMNRNFRSLDSPGVLTAFCGQPASPRTAKTFEPETQLELLMTLATGGSMTAHTTIPRSLLEQALNALLLPCDRWNKHQFKIVTAAANAIRAELAKPSATPAWHDAPTQLMQLR
jgi:hypothetical protein